MIICSCNVLSDTDVKNAVCSKPCPQTPGAVYKCLGCAPSCGRCLATVRAILNENLPEHAIRDENFCARFETAEPALCQV